MKIIDRIADLIAGRLSSRKIQLKLDSLELELMAQRAFEAVAKSNVDLSSANLNHIDLRGCTLLNANLKI